MTFWQGVFAIAMIVALVFMVAPFILSGQIDEDERQERGED